MKVLGSASTDQVIQVFQGDSKVLEQQCQWPDTPTMRFLLVRIAQRPADRILSLAWKLCEFEKDEFLKGVFAVWPRPGSQQTHAWTLEEMFNGIQGGWTPDAQKWANVQTFVKQFSQAPPTQLGPFIAYQRAGGTYWLEDGHTRLTAAYLANVFPPTLQMYVGERPA
jgi:hypothetical protein